MFELCRRLVDLSSFAICASLIMHLVCLPPTPPPPPKKNEWKCGPESEAHEDGNRTCIQWKQWRELWRTFVFQRRPPFEGPECCTRGAAELGWRSMWRKQIKGRWQSMFQNFPLLSEKSIASISCTPVWQFGYFAADLVTYWSCNQYFWSKVSVTGKFSNKINFGSYPGFPLMNSTMRITRSVTQTVLLFR